MEPLFFPNYRESILNVSNSILHHYRAKTTYPTLKEVDQVLTDNIRNVVLIVIDAMGEAILDRYSKSAPAFMSDHVRTISSVFPPTTVAATTSVLSGLPPIRTGWLGWMQYVKEEKRNVVFYTNQDYYDETHAFTYPVGATIVPYTTLYEQIEKASPDVLTKEIFPAFREANHTTFSSQCDTIVKTCKEPGRHFIYCYWDKLDTLCHETGPVSDKVERMMKELDQTYQTLIQALPEESVVVVIADHGQVAVEPIALRDYPDLWDLFLHEPSIESRATAFFIKPGCHEQFETTFNQYFRDRYILYPSRVVREIELFGEGPAHPRIDEFLGDYLAIAIDHSYFKLHDRGFVMKGQHAGLLAEESLVPLIIHSKR
ncbi:MAG: alkaline phosphatase family protein [Candidatus Izemoplasmatales bacterium]|nr:alkaline phosphatase family protein [Candidatus Izemoplasmatales bacterium]